MVALTRWLGPWASSESVPRRIRLERVVIDEAGRPFDAWLYHPRRLAVGSYVLAPGLHYDGPADPRMRRFCAILARAGFRVLAPFLPGFVDLRVTAEVIDDFAATVRWMARRRTGPIGLFSISFGSLPALRIAAGELGDRVSHVICFGGYADFADAMRFALSGDNRDPLNQPAVFINLIDELDAGPHRDALIAGWMAYMRRVWGRPEMKAADRYRPIAAEVAASIPKAARELFEIGCGLRPGALELCRAALARRGVAVDFVDPRPHLSTVRSKVYLIHGRDDDVIPHTHAEMLRRSMPPAARAEVLLTGLYDHTRSAAEGGVVSRARLLMRESSSMLRILAAITRGGRATIDR